MKTYLFSILFVFNFSVYSQETKASELDTIRQQGYLIMETNGTNKLNDIPLKFLFIPTVNIEKNLGTSYMENSQSNYKDLYIPTPYVFNSNNLLELNIFRNKFTKEKKEIKLNQQIVPTIDLLNKCNSYYRFKENLGQSIKTFKVIYLDGLWVKLKVPKKSGVATFTGT
ncbi:hypothetical protein CLU81_3738 [Flavobacterium sp. 9]|uniref:hypothetical protein n=1 Tax=Flavobacterium sp. 9 TaxID=2035198 RepID=UPI000C191337|nr:hypothetical protein [Flavobacterium sp. 9]PIF33162.1 hypothetical protein CLU81_3738 [Flavobacterium sp. 9]